LPGLLLSIIEWQSTAKRYSQWIGEIFEAYDEKLVSSNFLRLMDLEEDEEMG
jgi:hypothetical protein